jgi:KDO2-lipid IV(A) lauroyltransferase
MLGQFLFLVDRKHRRIAQANLRTAFGPGAQASRLQRIARRSFIQFGAIFSDIIKTAQLPPERRDALLTVRGEENLALALREGKGVLLFTAHLGNWEIASGFVSKACRLSVIARALDNPLLEAELAKLRKGLGAHVIYKKQAAREILQRLRRNEAVAILIDQNVLRSEAVFVDFFGKPAATTPSLAAFHLRTKAPILPVFCLPAPKGKYQLHILERLLLPGEGDQDKDVLKITQVCTKIIEDWIRKNPVSWFWFHNRWKSRPKDEKSD